MMNAWYPHYPGDYGRDTAHLSLVQHGAYRLLLDHYYATATPLPADVTALYRICRAFDEAERKAVDFVVAQFFELLADGYHNARADMELAKRAEQHERLSNGAKRAMRNRWGADKQATKQPIKQAIASPQPQPQPKEEKKNLAAKTAPPDPRHKTFFDFAYEAFRMKFMQPPAWGAQHAKGLQSFLKRSPQTTLEEWQRRYRAFLASTDRFYQQQRGSLLFFAAKFDAFIEGPILERTATNGKPSLADAFETTLASHVRFEQDKPN